jgi:putative PIN family toxin of toxin-antitoxin system
MRVVLDTNVVLSAVWTPGGLEAKLVEMSLAGELTACVSAAVTEEYRDVLFRPKFAKTHERARGLLEEMERTALTVWPEMAVSAAADEDDNRFLECALAAQAEYLVTGNLRDYPGEFEGTKILNARGFFDAISG